MLLPINYWHWITIFNWLYQSWIFYQIYSLLGSQAVYRLETPIFLCIDTTIIIATSSHISYGGITSMLFYPCVCQIREHKRTKIQCTSKNKNVKRAFYPKKPDNKIMITVLLVFWGISCFRQQPYLRKPFYSSILDHITET